MGDMDGNSNLGGVPITPGGTVVASQPLPTAMPMMAPVEKKKSSILEIIILVIVSLVAVAGIGLAVYFYLQWDESRTNVDGQIAEAVAVAREDQQRMAEENFAQREKEPFLEFLGPTDYGSLSFKFSRTWSVYVAKDASQGGDFEAYFNPGRVNAVGPNTINALRVTIVNQPFETVQTTYDNLVKSGKLTQSVFQLGAITGSRYEGEFNANITGIMVMFKIPNYPQTAILRADAMGFRVDFDKLIQTITTR